MRYLQRQTNDDESKPRTIHHNISKQHLLDTMTRLVYQDLLDENSEDVSLVFFELANASEIEYRTTSAKNLVLRQDVSACGQHTGGIVWETAYLLVTYLQAINKPLKRLLEVGAGCGLVSLSLSNLADLVVASETYQVLPNLQANLERNHDPKVRSCALDWMNHQHDMARNELLALPFDTILGTDVIFSPALVEPLLETLAAMSHTKTRILLCVQVRCATSHQLLFDKAGSKGLQVKDVTETTIAVTPQCQWGIELECHLLELRRL